jgi:hypothetical protein
MNDKLVQSINNKLPIELIHIILKYMEQPQPPLLVADILSFIKTRAYVCNAYYNKWIIGLDSSFGEDIDWLENDIIRYANNYVPTMIDIQPKFRNILHRFCKFIKVEHLSVHTFIKKNNNIYSKTKINMLWGLLTPTERGEFILNMGQFA